MAHLTDGRESIESKVLHSRHCSRELSTTNSHTDPEKRSPEDHDSGDALHAYETDGSPLEISPSHLSQPPTPYIPNGGLIAWLQVLSGFFLFFNSWGLINAFGVFQSYYSRTLIPHYSDSAISWIGSIEAFLLCCTTIFAGPIFDRGHARGLVFGGALLVVFGLMMTSLCRTYWQLMLAQGLCQGIGHGALFIVAIAIVPSYFSTKRSFAIGLAASGSSLGGVIYSIVFHRLVEYHGLGFAWATRVLGFIALATLTVPCACIKARTPPAPRKKLVDFDGFRELPFSLFNVASFVGFIGLYVPFFYISTFASQRAGLGDTLAFYMLPIISAGSIAGRILPGFVADFLGPLNVLATCTLTAGVLGLCWVAIGPGAGVGGLVVWSLLYGAFSGAFVSLQPSTVVSITDDLSRIGGRLGLNTFCAALGLLIGTPIAGVLLQKDPTFLGLQIFCGVTLFLGGGFVVLTRWSRVGWAVSSKA